MARTLGLLACLSALLACSSVAQAQRRVPASRTRPVLSPYIGLFQGNNAGLNSYFAAVRPLQRVENFAQQMDYELAMQQRLINQRSTMLQEEIQDVFQSNGPLTQRPTTGAGGVLRRPPGSFMNYSRFFPQGTASQSQPRSFNSFGP